MPQVITHKSYPKWEFDWSYKVVMVCNFTAPVMPSTMPTCLLCFALSPWHQAITLDRMPKKVDSLHSYIHNRMLDSDMCFRVGIAFIFLWELDVCKLHKVTDLVLLVFSLSNLLSHLSHITTFLQMSTTSKLSNTISWLPTIYHNTCCICMYSFSRCNLNDLFLANIKK